MLVKPLILSAIDASFYSPMHAKSESSLLPIHASPIAVSPEDFHNRGSILYSTSNSPSGSSAYRVNPFLSPSDVPGSNPFVSPLDAERPRSYPPRMSAYGGLAYFSPQSSVPYEPTIDRPAAAHQDRTPISTRQTPVIRMQDPGQLRRNIHKARERSLPTLPRMEQEVDGGVRVSCTAGKVVPEVIPPVYQLRA